MKRITSLIIFMIAYISINASANYQLNCTGINRPIEEGDFQISSEYKDSFSINNTYLSKDGKPWTPVMGEFHYSRFPNEEWENQLGKMKAAGISIVATYILWNHHEVKEGVWNWSDDNDLTRFIKLCQENGLYVWLRIGPYCNAEAANGGIPRWANAGKRTNNAGYIAKVERYFQQVAQQAEGLYVKDGGPIVGLQLENEFASGDPNHIDKLKEIAVKNGMIVPFYSLTGNSVFHDNQYGFLPLQGAYAYRGWQRNAGGIVPGFAYDSDVWGIEEALGRTYYELDKYPRGLCEQGTGSPMKYYDRFMVEPAVIEAHVQNQIGRGMNLIGYYMFQGGTQVKGLNSTGWPLSYDFQAPLSEFGEVKESYKRLKLYHHFVNAKGEFLAKTQVYTEHESNKESAFNTETLRYCGRFDGGEGFVFINNTQKGLNLPDKSFKITCKIESGSMTFPQKEFTIKNNESVIFPVNMKLTDKITLNYSTAQYLATIDKSGRKTHFFVKKNAQNPEFSFSEKPAKVSSGWELTEDVYTATIEPSEANLSISFENATIILLSLEEGLNSYITATNNLFITDAEVIMSKDKVTLLSKGEEALKVYIFNAGNNSFEKSLFEKKSWDPKLNLAQTGHCRRLNIDLPSNLPENVSNIFVKIDYRGSKAELFADDELHTDHFFYGATWSIGLKRFIDSQNKSIKIKFKSWDIGVRGLSESLKKEMYTKITPYIKTITTETEYNFRLEL
ncbi:MAG: beta-galactosidase [Spirochaetales bacterium]|nr:beta-galactosidase [Spirochaetales bacterium]